MLYFDLCALLSRYLFYFSFLFLLPLSIACTDRWILQKAPLHPHIISSFLYSILCTWALSACFALLGKRKRGRLYQREAILLVPLIWFISGFVGAFPFLFSKTLENPLDAYFESISGLTTTGASVMVAKQWNEESGEEQLIEKRAESLVSKSYFFYGTIHPVQDEQTGKILFEGIEAVDRSILFWRSFLQWIGGMGMVVLFVALFPLLGIGGKALYESEVPGPIKDSFTPKIRESSLILWKIYIFLSGLEVILLMSTNAKIGFVEACALTCSTLSTGGFTMTNASTGSYRNAVTEWITLCFMFLGSINFSLYFSFFKRKWRRIWDEELWLYLLTLLLGSSCLMFSLVGTKGELLSGEKVTFSLKEAIRYGCYQYVSAQTSTGFATANYDLWAESSQFLMGVGMFLGGMAGSTGGGLKIIRYLLLCKCTFRQIHQLFHPKRVIPLRLNHRSIPHAVLFQVGSFFFIALFFSLLGTLLYLWSGVDLETAWGLNACMINNIGIAFRTAGPTDTFAFLSPMAKIISILWMVLGRLEFFFFLILFFPSFWKNT